MNLAQHCDPTAAYSRTAPLKLYVVPHKPLAYAEKRARMLAFLGDGNRTRAELLTVPGLTANDVDRLLYALLRHGLVRKSGPRRCKVYVLA